MPCQVNVLYEYTCGVCIMCIKGLFVMTFVVHILKIRCILVYLMQSSMPICIVCVCTRFVWLIKTPVSKLDETFHHNAPGPEINTAIP